ncbi:hypothetical protein JYT74_02940 [Crocinitomix catalasitica]|nr:hypothetical protein [Crocinitomix catalasitica]
MAGEFTFTGNFSSLKGKAQANVSVNLVQFKQDGAYVIFAPALEVYGYGKTVQEAKDSFILGLEEFLSYTTNKNTLKSELQRLGWKIKGRKSKRKFKIPDFSEMLLRNDRLIEIMNTQSVRTFQADIPMAIPA